MGFVFIFCGAAVASDSIPVSLGIPRQGHFTNLMYVVHCEMQLPGTRVALVRKTTNEL